MSPVKSKKDSTAAFNPLDFADNFKDYETRKTDDIVASGVRLDTLPKAVNKGDPFWQQKPGAGGFDAGAAGA